MYEITELEQKPIPTHFSVQCTSLKLFESATFLTTTLDSSFNEISKDVLVLTNEQYNQWTNDDNFILTLVANTLGKKQAPVDRDPVTID